MWGAGSVVVTDGLCQPNFIVVIFALVDHRRKNSVQAGHVTSMPFYGISTFLIFLLEQAQTLSTFWFGDWSLFAVITAGISFDSCRQTPVTNRFLFFFSCCESNYH